MSVLQFKGPDESEESEDCEESEDHKERLHKTSGSRRSGKEPPRLFVLSDDEV
jgi:hypothetical protein